MKIHAQRLRNLTTGRLHTEMGHIYEDLGMITGEKGLMTHMLGNVMKACQPWLLNHVVDLRFWNDKYDTAHDGIIELPEPTEQDRADMLARYLELPNPLFGMLS